MKPVIRYRSQLLFRKSYRPSRLIRIRPHRRPHSSCVPPEPVLRSKHMNTQPIESGFAQMGARVKVREIPSRWTQGGRSWISPQDYSLDIQRDGKGEFFELFPVL